MKTDKDLDIEINELKEEIRKLEEIDNKLTS